LPNYVRDVASRRDLVRIEASGRVGIVDRVEGDRHRVRDYDDRSMGWFSGDELTVLGTVPIGGRRRWVTLAAPELDACDELLNRYAGLA
jgi:hypothetical protein